MDDSTDLTVGALEYSLMKSSSAWGIWSLRNFVEAGGRLAHHINADVGMECRCRTLWPMRAPLLLQLKQAEQPIMSDNSCCIIYR